MRKTTKILLLIGSFSFIFVLSFSVALAKAEDVNQANVDRQKVDTDVNEINTNDNQDQSNINKTLDTASADQEKADENKINNEPVGGIEHRSVVANFVRGLLDVADREKNGIGEEVRAIAQAQNDTKEQEVGAIDKIQKRGKVKTFLIGTDYKNIGQLRSAMVKTGNQIDQLKKLLDKTTSDASKTDLQAQITVLEQEQQKINDFIKTNESKFSLFGWVAKLFSK